MQGKHLRGQVRACRGGGQEAEVVLGKALTVEEGSAMVLPCSTKLQRIHTKFTSLSVSRARTRRRTFVLPELVVFHKNGFKDLSRSARKSTEALWSLISRSSSGASPPWAPVFAGFWELIVL
jgi:hypothetical protein